MGLVRWGDAASSSLGMLASGSGIVVGGATIAGGGAMLGAPDPTLVTKVAGISSITFGSALFGKSWADLTLNTQNLISALKDQPANVPSSILELGAQMAFPNNESAQLLAVGSNLAIDLASGRVPVGIIPDIATTGSALQTTKLANFSDYANYQSAARGTNKLPIEVSSFGSSFITNSVNTLQGAATAQSVMNNFDSISKNIGSYGTNGGFVLYPNRPNTNMIRAVYSK